MKITRELNLTLDIDTDAGTLSIVSYEPETGMTKQGDFGFNPAKHKRFDEWIGNEVYSWASIWAEGGPETEEAPAVSCGVCAIEPDVIKEPADNQLSEEGYHEPYPTF